jgi:hypothetical protein
VRTPERLPVDRRARSVPEFVIVGTPRSGTTLVQRLADELEGVRVPPETHFFSHFALGLSRRRRFPLDSRALRDELSIYEGLDVVRGLGLDPERVIRILDGTCSRHWDLYSAIVQALTPDAIVRGEKTPEHLSWWSYLDRAAPALLFVVVVRDPRAVVFSNRASPFGMSSIALLAEKWRLDQRAVRELVARVGGRRALVLRYEDVVADPGAAQRSIASFIGVASPAGDTEHAGVISLPWETWKASALAPIRADRPHGWEDTLADRDVATVVGLCRREMDAFGYAVGRENATFDQAGWRDRGRLLHYRMFRSIREAQIRRLAA